MVTKNFFKNSVIVLALLSLPSCKWFSKNQDGVDCVSCCADDSSTTLLTVDGRPALTQRDFDNLINEITEANEQAKLMLQLIPDFREQFFKAKKQAIVISEWAKRTGVRNTPEYKKKENRMMEAIKESLDSEEFIKNHSVEVSDEDALKYYEENKDKDPRIASATAGVHAVGVSFGDAAKANDFAKKLKAAGNKNVDSLAKENKLSVTSFGTITQDSMVDNAIKAKALSAKQFPESFVVKDANGKSWVVVVKSKDKGTYKKFEEVSQTIKHMLKPRKLEEMVNTELPKLEAEYKIVENSKFFEDLRKKSEQDQAAQAQEMAMAAAPKAPAKELSGAKPANNKHTSVA
jgi:inorganic pyrophosphatase